MAGHAPRSALHAGLEAALLAQPLEHNGADLRLVETDAWHIARDPFGDGQGVELAPAHLDHLALALTFGRGRRTTDAQRRSSDAAAITEAVVYVSMRYRPHGSEMADYRRAMDAAELVAHTIETTGWAAGTAWVEIDEDWSPRWVEGQPVIITPITFRIYHERSV